MLEKCAFPQPVNPPWDAAAQMVFEMMCETTLSW